MIIEQFKYDEDDAIEIEKDWKILTFNMVLPFGLVGFLAKVFKVLADEKIPIFSISAYSTDHILVNVIIGTPIYFFPIIYLGWEMGLGFTSSQNLKRRNVKL